MNFDAALQAIVALDGHGVDLGRRVPESLDFPLAEYRRRYARLAALMDDQQFGAIVFTQEEPIRYLTGYNTVAWLVGRWIPTVLVVTRDARQTLLITSTFDAGCASGTAWPSNLTTYDSIDQIPGLVRDHLSDAGIDGAEVGFELGPGSIMAIPQLIALRLLALGGEEPRDASEVWHAIRMTKSPLEVERVRRSVSSAVAGYRAGLDAAKPGMTERELVSVIGSTMYRAGTTAGTRPVFVNSVSGRERYHLVDTPASDRQLVQGDIVFVDGGGATDGYVSDILRLIGIGPVRAEDRRFAEVAADATAAMVQAVRPGIRVSELLHVASASVRSAGITDPVGVVAGHGIGLEPWERPLIKDYDDPDDDVSLVPGMVLCLEPILAPAHPDGGLAGIFVFEQQVVVTEAGCDVLSGELPARLWEVAA